MAATTLLWSVALVFGVVSISDVSCVTTADLAPTVNRFSTAITKEVKVLEASKPRHANLCNWKNGTAFSSYLLTDHQVYDRSTRITKANIGSIFERVGNKRIFVVFSGYSETIHRHALLAQIDQILQKGNAVIYVDWEQSSDACYETPNPFNIKELVPCFTTQAMLVGYAGRKSAELFVEIFKQTKSDPEDFEVLGFSFGAHVAGICSRYMFHAIQKKFAIIYGLDPAGPMLTDCAELHLRSGDAHCVTFIDTNAGILGTTDFGAADTSFVVDGGTLQNCDYALAVVKQQGFIPYIVCCHAYARRVWSMFFVGNQLRGSCLSEHSVCSNEKKNAVMDLGCKKNRGPHSLAVSHVPCFGSSYPDFCKE